ncbi:MAG: hypothetical protein CL489_01205 [Acidobacteria bacterium]|jgi:hypothetical protein|nr:hypothetical protein [Acidobacteriota bacterium]
MVQSLPIAFYPTVSFKRDSATHSLLCLTQVMSRDGEPGCSVDDALHVLCGKFSSRTKVERSVEVLFKGEYIRSTPNDRWIITNRGREALLIAIRNVLKG